MKYKNLQIPARENNLDLIKKGTVYICNNNYGQYKGEIAIALEDLQIDTKRVNIIGNINDNELFLLKYITEYTRFEFEY